MAATNTRWKKDDNGDDLLNVSIDFHDINFTRITNNFSIELKCRKLPEGKAQKSATEIYKILTERCIVLFTDAFKRSKLRLAEGPRGIIDLFTFYFRDQRVDMDTVETDEERARRIAIQREKNRAWFDKFSD